jgi:hypothetical protein
MLPNHPTHIVVRYTDKAVGQLTKKFIRHWPEQDEFCLTHEENERIRDESVNLLMLTDFVVTVSGPP